MIPALGSTKAWMARSYRRLGRGEDYLVEEIDKRLASVLVKEFG